jgi:uncharacterized protein (TIGR02145 family)
VATARALSGDATLSNTGVLTLANSGVTASTYKSVTVDAKGRVTAGTNPTTLAGYGITNGLSTSLASTNIIVGSSTGVATARALSGDATLSNTGVLTLANSGVTASTYKSVTVDAKGRVTAGTNPTTIAGYGITNAYTMTNMQTSGQAQLHFGNLTSRPTTVLGYGITDAMTTAHPANAITGSNITNWNTAYGWGDHTGLYRLSIWVPSWTDVTDKPTTFAPSTHSHSAADITSGTLNVARIPILDIGTKTTGTLSVARGGTGATTFTSGNVLIGSGTGAITTLSRSGIDTRTFFPPETHTHSVDDITTGTLAVSRGGTGLSSFMTGSYIRASGTTTLAQMTPEGVRSDIGAAPIVHSHSAIDITAGVLSVARGGTEISTYITGNYIRASGASSLEQRTPAQVRADIGAAATSHSHSTTDITSGTLSMDRIPTGTSSSTVALGNHTHGNITNDGKIGTAPGRIITTGTGGAVQAMAGTSAGEMLYWNGTAWVNVPPGTSGQVLIFINGKPTWGSLGMEDDDVQNPITGKIWMNRNIGATQMATSSNDAAAYGYLYQWGRGSDFHQLRTSGTTTTLSSSDTPGHGNFILAPSSPYDWRSGQNNFLWQGVASINNPCPAGYRLPTSTEWDSERLSWSSNNAAGAFASPLKLTVAGYRSGSDGLLVGVGIYGCYWSSTVNSSSAFSMNFLSNTAGMNSNQRAVGGSVRCIKE